MSSKLSVCSTIKVDILQLLLSSGAEMCSSYRMFELSGSISLGNLTRWNENSFEVGNLRGMGQSSC